MQNSQFYQPFMDETPITPISLGSNTDIIHEYSNFEGLNNINVTPLTNQESTQKKTIKMDD